MQKPVQMNVYRIDFIDNNGNGFYLYVGKNALDAKIEELKKDNFFEGDNYEQVAVELLIGEGIASYTVSDVLKRYHCAVYKFRDLAHLCSLRNDFAAGMFGYKEYLTKEEISKLLENENIIVAVKGLGEIDKESLDSIA